VPHTTPHVFLTNYFYITKRFNIKKRKIIELNDYAYRHPPKMLTKPSMQKYENAKNKKVIHFNSYYHDYFCYI
jgi:hypothetical protein